ncbi:FecR family protein [Bacteroides acidifaciens]|uniref:FecR family protein n=1 Tax=Bacteroides acidifaciens TaxID=85831 RepID=UPI0023D69C06|nr:FecR family protein [Bacteroides acidifaciens]MDE6822163.1 FecR family protein [Bacteroides acidifaciens]
MENWTESLDKYLEEGKLPLIGDKFSRKKEIGDKLKLQREESHKIALSRRRKQGAGRNIPFSWGIAAMFLLLLGVGGYYFSEKKIVTEGTAMAYELPDGSNVRIMANSRLTYNRIVWLWERKLQLLGKASFEVTKGKTFTVRTEAGDVTVLGTKFLIDQKGKNMFVNCEEGSVKVETAVGKRTLVAGESVRCDENKIVTISKPDDPEFPEVLGYEDDPLINVVADIEHIFKVTVVGHEKCDGLTYNGKVLTRDLKATLENVFGSCGISYELHGKEIILK